MGELAGHERRGSWTWPGRSAILGLLAAAKGIRRDGDFSELDALRLAVAVFDEGAQLRDYHTVQTVPTVMGRRPQSRPAALRDSRDRLNTAITLRDYRICPLYGVAVWGDGLDGLKQALVRPAFPLYLGRKSCPLALPVGPEIVSAQDELAAFSALRLPPWRPIVDLATITVFADLVSDDDSDMIETRHDRSLDRRRWHFSERRFRRCTFPFVSRGGGV